MVTKDYICELSNTLFQLRSDGVKHQTQILSDNHVFDESKSVAWNKAEVVRNNTKHHVAIADISKQVDTIISNIISAVTKYTASMFECSESVAEHIIDYVLHDDYDFYRGYDIQETVERIDSFHELFDAIKNDSLNDNERGD